MFRSVNHLLKRLLQEKTKTLWRERLHKAIVSDFKIFHEYHGQFFYL